MNIVFKRDKVSRYAVEMQLPCGQCIGCRVAKSREWALRCVHEASLHLDNSFVSLTFNRFNLPEKGSLDVSIFQKFMKRLRRRLGKVRYFHCGEYGSRNRRPHHHVILFGLDFPDKELFKIRNGNKLYRSKVLEELWPYGFSSIGSVTFESAAYVARYCMKKINGLKAREHYGELKPEFVTMSRRPGIGAGWFSKFSSDVFPSDFLVCEGSKFKVPRFYDNLFSVKDPVLFTDVKARRLARADRKCVVRKFGKDMEFSENSLHRLRAKEVIASALDKGALRSLEDYETESL